MRINMVRHPRASGFCELNFTGCEQSRSEMERWKILHSAKDLKQKKRNVKRSADVSGNARHSAISSSTTQDVSIVYQLLFINKKTQYTL